MGDRTVHILVEVRATLCYVFVKFHRTAHLQRMNFTVYNLHLIYLTLERVKGWYKTHPMNASEKYWAHSIICLQG